MGLCFSPKPAREQQVLVLKTTLSDVLLGCENLCTLSKVCSSNEKLNETTKGNNFKCGEHSLNFVEMIVDYFIYYEGLPNGPIPEKIFDDRINKLCPSGK